MTEELPKKSFIPFSGKSTDWLTWRTQFSALNVGNDISELLADKYEKPSPMDNSTKRKSQLLYRNLIVCTKNAGIASNITMRLEFASTFDGIGAWKALCKKFERSTKSHRINDVLRSFHSSSYNPDMDPEIYLHILENLKTMAQHYEPQYDGVISDLLIRNKVMDELEQYYPYHVASFNSYIANQERQATLNDSEPEIDIFELVEPASREYNNRAERKGQREKSSVQAAAFATQGITNNAVICMWCGMKGHYAAKCRQKERDLRLVNTGTIKKLDSKSQYSTKNGLKKGKNNQNADLRSCIICKSHNHGTKECPRLTKRGEHQEASHNTNVSLILTTTYGSNDHRKEICENEVEWIVDSGSTYHVTPYIEDLTIRLPYKHQHCNEHCSVNTYWRC